MKIKDAYNLRKTKGIRIYIKKEYNKPVPWESFLTLFDSEEPLEDIRSSKRPQRKIFLQEIEGVVWFIKKLSYSGSGRIRDIFRGWVFLSSSGMRQLRASLRIKAAGVTVLTPAVLLEKKKGFLKKESLFISEDIGGKKMSDLLADPGNRDKWKELFEGALKDLRLLHNEGVTHGDANAGNIMIIPQGERVWLDLDRVRYNTLYNAFKGRFYDLDIYFRSIARSLKKSGSWNAHTRDELISLFIKGYRGGGLYKKITIKRNKKKLEWFDE